MRAGKISILLLSLVVLGPTKGSQAQQMPLPADAWSVRPLLVGAQAANLELPTAQGQPLAWQAKGDKTTILVFYRGDW
ncbi:MAG: hypothetical protein GKR89_03220 [Candidatus Latescibacteria bacterium]|nr:hypothetical protein [Candidatus Latescibacterota bacterium]